MKKIRVFWRLVKFFGITTFRVSGIIILEKIFKPDRKRRDRWKMAWAKAILHAMGIIVEVKGSLPDKGVLITPNHRSYMDIPVLISLSPVSHLGKAEVQKWPLIGAGATAVDTLFVKRESASSRNQARILIGNMIRSGHPVCVHPEGTTVRAPDLLEFKGGAFFACAESGLPVVPVAIEYLDPNDAWVGDDTFLPHFLKAFGKKRTYIYISAGPEFTGTTAEELRVKSWEWVNAELIRIRKEKGIIC